MLIFKKHITLLCFTGILLLSFACKKKNQEVTNNVSGPQIQEPISYTLKSIYFASHNTTNIDIYEYDLMNSKLVKTINSDFGGMYTDAQSQQIVISGLEDDLVVYDTDFNEKWRVNAKNTSFPFFHHFEEGLGDDFDLFVSNEDAEIRSYSSSGITNNLITISESNLYPYAFGNTASGYTFVDVKNYSKSTEELHVFYTSTGYEWFKHDFKNKELVFVGDLGISSKNTLLFVNENGIGKVLISNIDTHVNNEFKDLGVEIVDVKPLNEFEFIVSTKSSGIGIYNYSSNVFSAFNTSVDNAQLLINKEDNRVVVLSGNTLYFLDDSGNVVDDYSHFTTILGGALMYE